MVGRRFAASWIFLAATSLSGCSQAINLYHKEEGGAIAQNRQPPPGTNLPYPNLADVPAPQPPAAPGAQAAITSQARNGVSAPAPGALAGLSLPEAPPPVPSVPGLTIQTPNVNAPAPKPAPAPALAPAPKPPGPAVGVAFAPGSALLPAAQQSVIQGVAAQRQDGFIRAVGFGDGSMGLALARARRIADALTAAGVPADKIKLDAFAAGSGGFVQLVY